MRKLMLSVSLAALTLAGVPMAHAAGEGDQLAKNLGMMDDGGGPGCGVGTMVFKGKTGVVNQVLASTTNGTFSNTFAITSGTSGCEADGVVMREHERQVYAAVNFRNLKQDIARGEGEYLAALETLMDVRPEDRAAFGAFARERFAVLFDSPEASPDTFLAALDTELLADGAFRSPTSR